MEPKATARLKARRAVQRSSWFLIRKHVLQNFWCQWNIPENIPPPPPWATLNWAPKTVRISKKDSSSLCRIPNPADSKSWGIPEIYKILNGFPGIPVHVHKIWRKFMEFQSSSPSIYYRISNVVHGGCADIFCNRPISFAFTHLCYKPKCEYGIKPWQPLFVDAQSNKQTERHFQ